MAFLPCNSGNGGGSSEIKIHTATVSNKTVSAWGSIFSVPLSVQLPADVTEILSVGFFPSAASTAFVSVGSYDSLTRYLTVYLVRAEAGTLNGTLEILYK